VKTRGGIIRVNRGGVIIEKKGDIRRGILEGGGRTSREVQRVVSNTIKGPMARLRLERKKRKKRWVCIGRKRGSPKKGNMGEPTADKIEG